MRGAFIDTLSPDTRVINRDCLFSLLLGCKGLEAAIGYQRERAEFMLSSMAGLMPESPSDFWHALEMVSAFKVSRWVKHPAWI